MTHRGQSREVRRGTPALTCAAGLWLALAAALFVPALLVRDRVPGGLSYVTLLFLPGVVPAIAGAALYSRLTDSRQGRSARPRRCTLFAFVGAFVATGAILVVQNVMDRDRPSGAARVGWLLAEVLTIGLGNAIIAALGSYGMRRLRRREAGPERAEQ